MEIDGINIFLFTLMGILFLTLVGQYSANTYRKLRTVDAGADPGGVELQVFSETLPSEQFDGAMLTNLQSHD
jgi:hypothetical protein